MTQGDIMFRHRTLKAAAKDLLEYLHRNAGDNADWPLDLVARDQESADTLCEKLNTLQKLVDE